MGPKIGEGCSKIQAILDKLDNVPKAIIEESGAREFLESLQQLSEILIVKTSRNIKNSSEYWALVVFQPLELRERSQEMKMECLGGAPLFFAY